MESKNIEKKIERISKMQKEKLVEYMAKNLEFARGKFSGINSNSKYKEEWEVLKTSLNSLGGSGKTVEQWKKCWLDLKCGVKKTVNTRRKFINQTGGGSWADVPRDLNALEEKILKIITVDAVDGDANTPESGVELLDTTDIVSEDPVEEYLSVAFLEGEEIYITPAKKQKKNPPISTPSTSKSAQNKFEKPPISSHSNIPKNEEALDESRELHKELMTKINAIETQNKVILGKLKKIENILESKFK